MEAMATGKPVVATKVGGIPELVDDKINGFLINPGDTRTLAKKITYLLRNENVAVQMGEKGAKKARSYSWDKTAKRVKEIYENILENKL